jgi:hypothetical protein
MIRFSRLALAALLAGAVALPALAQTAPATAGQPAAKTATQVTPGDQAKPAVKTAAKPAVAPTKQVATGHAAAAPAGSPPKATN